MVTVLIVDDDPLVLRLVCRMAEHHGYDVECATDPREALQILRSDRPVDLLMTDCQMPAISGPDLALQARLLRPDLVIGFMSGMSMAEAFPDARPPAGAPFLAKMFGLDALGDALGRMAQQLQAARSA